MRQLRYWLLGVSLVACGSCDADGILGEIVVPYAGIQFVHAVSDTGEMDIRVVDIPSNAAFFDAEFREITEFHRNIEAGPRRITAFMSSLDPAISSDVVWDTVFNFQEGVKYTFALRGYARPGQTPALQAVILTDNEPASIPSGEIAVRVVHVAPTLDPAAATDLDAWIVPRGPGGLSGAPVLTGIGFGEQTSYVTAPTGSYRIAFTATGTTGPILFQANVPNGEAGDSTKNPIAGAAIAGSGITAVVSPRSVPFTRAPFSFTAVERIASITATGTGPGDTIATATTAAPHGLTVGDTVVVNGAVQLAYDGTFVVRGVPDPTTFTYKIAPPAAAAATGYPYWLRVRYAPSFNGRPVAALTAVGTTATLVTLGNHGLATNDVVAVTGANEAEYNGSFVVTVVNSTTFTYTTNGAPSGSPATGVPLYRAGSADFTTPNVLFRFDKRPPDTFR